MDFGEYFTISVAYDGISGCWGRDGTTLHSKARLLVESRKEPAMIPELFFLPPDALDCPAELPQLPHWLTLGLAGAAIFVTALALTLS
jgi:hypothetical protein